jgi:tetratricopeptide (TPR) repeat protein
MSEENIKDKEFEEFHKANIFLSKKEYNKAEKLLLLGLKRAQKEKLDYKISFYYSALGHLYVAQKRYSEALKFYDHAEKVTDDFYTKLSYASMLIFIYKNYDLALNKVEEAIKRIPLKDGTLNEAYSIKGLCFLGKGDKVNALKSFNKSLKVDFKQFKSSDSFDLTLASELIRRKIYDKKIESYLKRVLKQAIVEDNARLIKTLNDLIAKAKELKEKKKVK